jgi:hypothetical protein
MSRATGTVSLDPRAQALMLAQALTDRGFTTTVLQGEGHRIHPCVQISGGPRWRGTEWVYAAPEDGHWWFWWSSLELIAPIGQVTMAARAIARALRGQP